MADAFYNSFMERRYFSQYDWRNENVKVALLDNTYPAATGLATHFQLTDIASYEVVGNGYLSGGKIISVDSSGNFEVWKEGDFAGTPTSVYSSTILTAIPVEWTGATFSTRYAALYSIKSPVDPLIALLDFEMLVDVTDTFTLPMSADTKILEINTQYSAFYEYDLRKGMYGGITTGIATSCALQLISTDYTFDSAHTDADISPYSLRALSLSLSSTVEEGRVRVHPSVLEKTFTNVTGTARYVAVTDAGNLIALFDLGVDVVLSGNDFILTLTDPMFDTTNGVE